MNSKSHFQLQKRDPWKSFTKRIPPAACKTGVGYTYMYNLLLTDSMHASRISANAQMAGLKSAKCPKRQHFCVVAISNQLRVVIRRGSPGQTKESARRDGGAAAWLLYGHMFLLCALGHMFLLCGCGRGARPYV